MAQILIKGDNWAVAYCFLPLQNNASLSELDRIVSNQVIQVHFFPFPVFRLVQRFPVFCKAFTINYVEWKTCPRGESIFDELWNLKCSCSCESVEIH